MTDAPAATRPALDRLTDKSLCRQDAYVNGCWVGGSGARSAVRNPANRAMLAEVAGLTAPEAAASVEAAAVAFEMWRRTSAFERAKRLRAWFEAIMAAADDLAVLITAENGKPQKEAKGEVVYGAQFVEWCAEQAKRIEGDVLPSPFAGARTFALREPVGVVAAIAPWNFPLAMVTRKVAPALAAGCAVTLKPAPETPLTALALAALAERAELPKGLFNVVTGEASVIGPAIVEHAQTRMIAFTGSTATGKLLMRQAAEGVRKVALELGGDAPFVVFPDADLEAAADAIMASRFRCSGQTCVSANRIIAVGEIGEPLLAALEARVAKLKVGDGFAPGVEQGPLIHDRAVARVGGLVLAVKGEGGRVAVGGKALPELGGSFYAPTLIALQGASPTLRGAEIFGPVAVLSRAKDEAEALAMANDTPYGLAAYAFTRDAGRVFRLIEGLDYGMVGINIAGLGHASAPFGGVKQSGLGREGGRFGVEEFLEIKFAAIGGL